MGYASDDMSEVDDRVGQSMNQCRFFWCGQHGDCDPVHFVEFVGMGYTVFYVLYFRRKADNT
jgi:hypothetical protein